MSMVYKYMNRACNMYLANKAGKSIDPECSFLKQQLIIRLFDSRVSAYPATDVSQCCSTQKSRKLRSHHHHSLVLKLAQQHAC